MIDPVLPLPIHPPHAAERRQRRLGTVAMIALGLVGGCLVLEDRLARGHDDISFLHSEGPFPAAVSADGSVQLGTSVDAFHRGDAFGWSTSLCVPPETEMTIQVRLVQLADNHVLLYRERQLPVNAHGCSTSAWNVAVPPSAEPGHYVLQQFVLLTPPSDAPRTHTLPPMAIDVVE